MCVNPLESQLHYPLGEQIPAPGQVLEVAPGLLWLRMGLPFALNHINLWLLQDQCESADGPLPCWTVIDCGIADAASRANWQAIFATHLRGWPVGRVLVTHCHPDHLGLSAWLCAYWQAPLWMSAGEYAFGRMMTAALPGADGSAALPHFQKHGLQDPLLLAQLRSRHNYYPALVPDMPEAFVRLFEGQVLRIGPHGWRVITGFGHSPEHVALYCDSLQVLIAGDMVLPRISTNVSVFAIEPESNPVQLYLDSLKKYAALPSDTLVLPSHGKPFRGLQARIAQLEQHHAARLAEVEAACVQAQSAADIVPLMFRRPLDAHQLGFALGEALAHQHQLWFAGKLQRTLGDDGVIRFTAISPAA